MAGAPCQSHCFRCRQGQAGGRLLEHESRLYRPAQDGSVRYGYGTHIQEIVTLSEYEYCEREAGFIEPLWDKNIIATHTFSRAGDLIFIDALEEIRDMPFKWRKPAPTPARLQ